LVKVKILSQYSEVQLESEINEFIAYLVPEKIFDIKYSSMIDKDDREIHSALIIYKESD
jgi:hypothetical protein